MAAPTIEAPRSTTREYKALIAAYSRAARGYTQTTASRRAVIAGEAARAAWALHEHARRRSDLAPCGEAWADIARRWEARRP